MKIPHPYEWLSESGQNRAFIALFVVTIAVMMSLNIIGRPLITKAAPRGIVSFEFAGNNKIAQGIIDSWGQKGQVYAGLSLGLDYLFLLLYSCCIALGCVLVARHLFHRVQFLSPLGRILAWAQFPAAILDATENYGLIRVLLGSDQNLWPVLARWAAIPKFLIVILGLLYVIFGLILILVVKKSRPIQKIAR
jgi:hypothetical protein